MNKKITISIGSVIALSIAFIVGVFIGKGYVDTVEVEKEVVKWKTEQLPPIYDTISMPVPYLVFDTDTVFKIIDHQAEVDTLKILADYYRVRKYNLDFSNDSIGVFKVNIDVTKNMLANASSEIRPIRTTIERVKTINKVQKLQFYGMFGSSLDFKTNKIQVGLDFRQKYLLGVSGIRLDNKYGYTIDLGVKF